MPLSATPINISNEKIKSTRDAIIERNDHLEYSNIPVAVFGPFSSKFNPYDGTAIEKSLDDSISNSGDVAYEFLEENVGSAGEDNNPKTGSQAQVENEFLNEVKNGLRDKGVNAFVASDVPPFSDQENTIEDWEDYFDDAQLGEWDYVTQSYIYSKIANINIFVFRYLGNPVGVTYEIADIFRGARSDDQPEILEQSLLWFESRIDEEIRANKKYTSRSEEEIRQHLSDSSGPHYLSAMLEHVTTDQNSDFEPASDVNPTIWEPFQRSQDIIDKTVAKVKMASNSDERYVSPIQRMCDVN
ncbi:DUF7509 family protein [Halostagnicola kamekurae]|uniref:DUF7509 domain-containing protein n=1 Tax=Halostagnicola kamekurae TaxID=619731 RepID=A0A1I6TUK1_9EURY|nr:hypothetical protein [Halostagnicola kamekurae]SFS92667.1 hypothetical protein SAMN04488556_3432 [Halostagnicola kamekurae]